MKFSTENVAPICPNLKLYFHHYAVNINDTRACENDKFAKLINPIKKIRPKSD